MMTPKARAKRLGSAIAHPIDTWNHTNPGRAAGRVQAERVVRADVIDVADGVARRHIPRHGVPLECKASATVRDVGDPVWTRCSVTTLRTKGTGDFEFGNEEARVLTG